MYYLIPGRHHLMTQGQFQALFRGALTENVTGFVFAVTSANHSNTRRNPVPFYQRALAIQEFAEDLPVPSFIYGIVDVGLVKDFPGYTLKQIRHMSEGRLKLSPQNCRVVAREPLDALYRQAGFEVVPFGGELPWDVVERISTLGEDGLKDAQVLDQIHPGYYKIWKNYGLGARTAQLFGDPLIGDDGDLTETRDYAAYVQQMDEIAPLKYQETAPFLQPGRVGDIGCAVGSWIKLACEDPRLAESDFFGIEVARPLYTLCEQRKANGEFANPYVFFSQRNAVSGLVFDPLSMNTIHTSSLTHEIESYGGRSDLLKFLKNRFEELAPGGVWVNRDVVGPRDKDRLIFLKLSQDDGVLESETRPLPPDPQEYLNGLSTYSRFFHFIRDFRPEHAGRPGEVPHRVHEILPEKGGVVVSLGLALDYLAKKDYTDNWKSEMHETFCFWDADDWQRALEAAGFRVSPLSRFYPNPWIIQNRFEGHAGLHAWDAARGEPAEALAWPETHMILCAFRD